MNRRSKFKSPFAFFGIPHKLESVQVMQCVENTQLCAVDLEGKPQALFTKSLITEVPCLHILKPLNQKVLGVPRSEGMELLEHKPTLLLAHNPR
jgi:hypothetical protein